MAFTAEHADTGDIHNVAQANPTDDYLCLDCANEVAHVRQHVRATPTGGNTTVASHFRCGCADGGGGGGGGGGVHESRIHKRRKRDALQEAVNRFEAADFDTETYLGEKRADALLTFDEPHEQYGKGLVIEYQHKNEGKDINATEQHFARREYTTVWLWEDQYTYDSAVPDIDLFGGRVYTPWPDAVPKADAWPGRGHDAEKREQWANAYDRGLTDASVPATIVRDWCIPTQLEYWRQHKNWDRRFRHSDYYPEARYRLQAAIGTGTTLSVDAKVPRHWPLPTQQEFWRAKPWEARFPEQHPVWAEPPVPTERRIEQVRDHVTSDARTISATLPPETSEQIKAMRGATSDGSRCPRCGSEAVVTENENWATVYKCSKNDHWARQTDYKGEMHAPAYNRGGDA
jgi:DNA-directed RNA polymerase subunit RPC12/RpoP